jgi:hypothetical protein
MKFQRAHQSSSWSPKNSPQQQTSQFASRPFAIEPQQESGMPPTQEQIENEAFEQQKFEATGLEIKQKDGSITPQEQEHLGVLQAKMDGLLAQRVERASRFGHNFANIAINSPDSSELAPIQAKLTIGQPGDKYEQEADAVAHQVVNQINQPQSQTIQREEMVEEEERLQMQPQISTIQRQEILGEEENELQMKSDWGILQREAISGEDDELQMQPQISTIQREAMPTEEEELQMKPMVQRLSDGDEMAASPDLEASIQQAKGSGQPLSDTIRKPMEQAFGADFSGVKIHADAKSDELNQSIQAKAFTTGTDIFFRQGAYNPGSLGGQELIAHELTHVVQQSEGMVQGKQPQAMGQTLQADTSLVQSKVLQRMYQQRYKNNTHDLAQQITTINGSRIQREGLTIQVLSGNDTPTKVTEVKIVGRPPKLFTNAEGDHTTAWAVISHVVKRELMGLTLSKAWDVLQSLYSEAQNLPGVNRAKYLADVSNQRAIYNLDIAKQRAEDYNSMDKSAMSQSDLAHHLQGFINAYLLYRNAIPFSAVSGGGTGHRESDYMEWMRVANGDETREQAQKWVPDPLNKTSIREAAWGLLDTGGVKTISEQIRRYEAPGIAAYATSDLIVPLSPSENSQDYDDDALDIPDTESYERLLDLLTQHLLTIKAAFPKAYADGQLDSDDSFKYLFDNKKRTYKERVSEPDSLSDQGMNLPDVKTISKDYRSKKEEFEKKERAKRDQIPDEFKKRELFTQKSEVGVQITLDEDNNHIQEIMLVGRPPKTYGKAEGDHVTAYAVLEQLIKYNLEGRPMLFAWEWLKKRIEFDKVELPGYDRIKNLNDTIGSKAKTNYENAEKAIKELIATDPDAGTVFPKLQQLIQAYLHFRNAFPLSTVFNPRGSINHGERVAEVKGFEDALNTDKNQALKDYSIDHIRNYMWGFFDAAAVKRMMDETNSSKAAGIGGNSDTNNNRLLDTLQQHLVTVETAFPTAFRVVNFDSKDSITKFLQAKPLSRSASDADNIYKSLANFEVKRKSVYPQKAELLVEDKIDEIKVTAADYGINCNVDLVRNYVQQQLTVRGYGSVDSTTIPSRTKYQEFLDKMDEIRPTIYAPLIAGDILSQKLDEIVNYARTQGLIINADEVLVLLSEAHVNLTDPCTVTNTYLLENYYPEIHNVTVAVYQPVIEGEKELRAKRKRSFDVAWKPKFPASKKRFS